MARRTPRKGHQHLPAKRQTRAGRPTKLTERTADAIIHAVLEGNHLTTAAHMAGINTATLHRWIERGDNVDEAIETGKTYAEDDLRFRDFRDRLADARAQAEARMVAVVQKAAVGGYLIHEKPLQNVNGEVMYDQNGRMVVERTYAQPDGRLALSYLGRSRPGQWGQSSQGRLEITGAGSGPVQVEHTAGDQISKLSERLSQVLAAQRADDGDGDEDIRDAEVVSDTDEQEME